MKKFFVFLFACSCLLGREAIVVDPYFSPYSGAPTLLTAHWMLTTAEDCWFKNRKKDTTLRVWGRAFEELFIWAPINSIASTTQHEIFGHGYRGRELGYRPTGYKIYLFGGWTSFNHKSDLSVGELLAIDVAGLEAEAILARQTKMKWMSTGKIDGRLSTLYTQAQQSIFWYTLITHLSEIKYGQSHGDVNEYIQDLNATYPEKKINIGTLTKWSVFNWIDPMTFYAYFSIFYYIAENAPWKFPTITISEGVEYLPNVRIAYAPYGPEAYSEHFFSIHGEPLYVYAKGGPRSAGIGFAYDNILSGRRGTIGIRFDAWSQNAFISSKLLTEDFQLPETLPEQTLPELTKKVWGAALSFTSTLNLLPSLALFAELGGKTKGYLPGYALGESVTARVGLVFGKKR